MIGASGVGKTHLAIALGLAACPRATTYRKEVVSARNNRCGVIPESPDRR